MMQLITRLFDTADFPARWHCGRWTALHGWTHIIADLAIFGAYAAIPAVLAYFVLRRRDIPFQRVFWLFVAFIFACGFGHLLEATIFWHPWYRLAATVKVLTAIVSWGTVVALVPILPRALSLPGLAAINQRLKEEIVERKRAEERFRLVVEAAPSGMVMADKKGRIVLVNGQTERLFGYGHGELLGKSVELLVPLRFRANHPRYREGFFAHPEARAMGKGRDLFGQRKDGSEFPVEIGLTPLATDEGHFVLSSIVDITDRKAGEDAIRQSESRKAAILESALDAIITMDHEGRIVEFNPAAERTFGYSGTEVLGKVMGDLIIPPAMRQAHARGLEHYLATGDGPVLGKRLELSAIRSDGSEFPCELTVTRIASGDPPMFTGYIRDVTERKRAEATLRENQYLLEKAQEVGHIGSWLSEPETGKLVWSKEAFRILGVPEDQFSGRFDQFISLVHPDDREAVRQASAAAVRDDKPYEIEHRIVRPDGTVRWIHEQATLVRGADRTVRLIGVGQDVTERKLAEEQIQQLNQTLERRVAERTAQLEAANKELEAFSYSVSHDLRAPLRAIDGFSRILLEEYAATLPDQGKEYLGDVRRNTQKMGRLVDDLLAFSRLGRQPIKRQSVASNRLVRQCLEELRGEQEGRRVEIRVSDLPNCSADPALLKQVWINLLSNALKYSGRREAALIEVGSREGDDLGLRTYYVKDNGVGFDMRYSGKLFGVFQRLHRAEDYDGTGVGLAIVQRIIHRHGGRVWAEAAPDRGASFFFTLAEGDTTDE